MKISVIVPVYNTEKYFEECLNSIINQTYRNLEIIIIDDGSTDGCGQICDDFSKKDDRVIVRHIPNSGVPTARNMALDLASGDWVTFVDSDDYLDLNLYQICVDKLNKTETDVVMFGRNIIGKKSRKNSRHYNIILRDEKDLSNLQASAISNKKYYKYDFCPTAFIWDKVYKRQIIVEHNILFPLKAYGQDDKVFNTVFFGYAKSFQYISNNLYNYRVVGNSLSHGYVKNRMEWDEAFYDAILKEKERSDMHISNNYMDAYYSAIVSNLWAACSRCFFHPDNIDSYKEQIDYVNSVLTMEPYVTALKKARYHNLKITERLIKLCSFRRAECMYIFYRIKIFLKRRNK